MISAARANRFMEGLEHSLAPGRDCPHVFEPLAIAGGEILAADDEHHCVRIEMTHPPGIGHDVVAEDLNHRARRVFLGQDARLESGMQFYALTWNLGTLRAKYRPSGVPMAVAPALQMLLGGLVTLIAAAIVGPWHWSYVTMRSGLALAYLALFGSVIAFSAYHYALRVMPAGKLSLYAYAQPAVAAIAGAVVLQERITIPMLVGMLLILGGVSFARHFSQSAMA